MGYRETDPCYMELDVQQHVNLSRNFFLKCISTVFVVLHPTWFRVQYFRTNDGNRKNQSDSYETTNHPHATPPVQRKYAIHKFSKSKEFIPAKNITLQMTKKEK